MTGIRVPAAVVEGDTWGKIRRGRSNRERGKRGANLQTRDTKDDCRAGGVRWANRRTESTKMAGRKSIEPKSETTTEVPADGWITRDLERLGEVIIFTSETFVHERLGIVSFPLSARLVWICPLDESQKTKIDGRDGRMQISKNLPKRNRLKTSRTRGGRAATAPYQNPDAFWFR
jgi:hypothetical protein